MDITGIIIVGIVSVVALGIAMIFLYRETEADFPPTKQRRPLPHHLSAHR